MLSKRVAHSAIGRVVFLAAILGISLASCNFSRWTQFDPIERDLPITMFERYDLQIIGFATASPEMIIDVSFMNDMTDTSFVDTIPVFQIDSICFKGECLGSVVCNQPLDWHAFNELLRSRDPGFGGYDRGRPHSYRDIWFRDGKLVPSGYRLDTDSTYRFPAGCLNSVVLVEIHARLLDRLSGKGLARETKVVEFQVRPRKQRIIISQVTAPTRDREGRLSP